MVRIPPVVPDIIIIIVVVVVAVVTVSAASRLSASIPHFQLAHNDVGGAHSGGGGGKLYMGLLITVEP